MLSLFKHQFPIKFLLPVVFISLFAAILNLLNVLIWAFHVPPDRIYLWVGHYFPDYLTYLQVMVQGQIGNWLVENPYATDEVTRTFLGWEPDLLIGKLGSLFRLSTPVTYWLSVGVFSFILALLIFYVVRSFFPQKPFYLPFSAFLLALFSTPFLELKNGQLIPFDYWYTPTSIFSRFGPVPRHILDQIIALADLLFIAKTLNQISRLSLKQIFFRSFLAALPLLVLLLFSLHSLIICGLLFFVAAYYLISSLLVSRNLFWRFLAFFAPIAVMVFPTALFIKQLTSQIGPLVRGAAWDLNQQATFTPAFFLLITGPILPFALIGFIPFLRKLHPLKLIFLSLFALTLIIIYSPLAPYLGVPSVRLFSPLNWITFAVLAICGTEFLAKHLHLSKLVLTILITLLILVYSVPAHLFFFEHKLNEDRKVLNSLNYFPKTLSQALQFLNTDSTPGAVLTRPEPYVGLIIPIFAPRHRVYLGRPLVTPEFDQKSALSRQFYRHEMTSPVACQFLTQNNISFVMWTYWDGTEDPIPDYNCLHPVYQTPAAIIFKLKS